MSDLRVNEIFQTIQGEGHHAGTPATFVRLQGCPVGCPWCDTKFTWELDPVLRNTADVAAKPASGSPAWTVLTPEQIARHTARLRHVVITGGEPAMHDLIDLTTLLTDKHDHTVQIETSGTFPVRCSLETWVTVSPKFGMPGGYAVRDDAIERADEIKMPVGNAGDIQMLERTLMRLWRTLRPDVVICLQPLSLSGKATKLCIEACVSNGWKLSLQTHRMIDLR